VNGNSIGNGTEQSALGEQGLGSLGSDKQHKSRTLLLLDNDPSWMYWLMALVLSSLESQLGSVACFGGGGEAESLGRWDWVMDGLTDEMRVDRERRVASSRRKKAFEDAESVSQGRFFFSLWIV